MIEETTNVTAGNLEKLYSASFSIVDAVNKDAIPAAAKTWLDEGMLNLDEMIRQNQTSSYSLCSSSQENTDINVVARPEKRKLTDDEKETQKELRENAKRAREAEKERKTLEKDKKKSEMARRREEKEKDKETRKIEREISAATNSKCELYTFCHVGKTVIDTWHGLEAELSVLYVERKIDNQLKIDTSLGTRIEWRRKCVELREDDSGRSERFEYSSTQNLFAVVVPAETLKDVISSNTLSDFIIEQKSGFQNGGRCTMLIVSFGRAEIAKKKKLHNLSLQIYEQHRAQIVQIETIAELALFTAQYLRSLARQEKKKLDAGSDGGGGGGAGGAGGHKLQYQGDKGIVIGSRSEIVTDWWSKMLTTIDRLSDAQRRAILELIPDPIAAIDKYSKMDYSLAIQEIGELVAENGRRVGPSMAHRILTMLTDETGNSVVE